MGMNTLMEKVLISAEARDKTTIEKIAYESAEAAAPWFDDASQGASKAGRECPAFVFKQKQYTLDCKRAQKYTNQHAYNLFPKHN